MTQKDTIVVLEAEGRQLFFKSSDTSCNEWNWVKHFNQATVLEEEISKMIAEWIAAEGKTGPATHPASQGGARVYVKRVCITTLASFDVKQPIYETGKNGSTQPPYRRASKAQQVFGMQSLSLARKEGLG